MKNVRWVPLFITAGLLLFWWFIISLVTGCTDHGVEPPAPVVNEWQRVENFHYARSAWLDFISVQFTVDAMDSTDAIDSLLVINHSDDDARYLAHLNLDPGINAVHHRFFFPDGYVDRLPFQLSLSVYVRFR